MTGAEAALLPAAAAALRVGRTGLAARLLRAAEAAGAERRTVTLLDARRALDQGDGTAARARLASWPPDPDIRRLRAEAALAMGDPATAAADAAACVVEQPDGPHAAADKALLGTALLGLAELGRGDRADAAACLAEALAILPGTSSLWCRLARAQPDAAARDTLARARVALPSAVDVRLESILQALRAGEPAAALALATDTIDAGLADAQVLGLLGHAHSLLGRHDEAADAYAAALTLAPDDPYVRHLARAGRRRPSARGDRAPPDYVRAVFDGYADRFDGHLIALGYRVPGMMRGLVGQLIGDGVADADGSVLDLGCGTGLLAVALSDLSLGSWTGVDLSPRMLAAAAATGLYATLHEAEIEAFLGGTDRTWPLILAGDVFCYFGELTGVLDAVARRLAPGGRLLFSVETDRSGPAWSLRANGRYAHRPANLLTAVAAAGLHVGTCADEALRREGSGVVAGLLVIAERPA